MRESAAQQAIGESAAQLTPAGQDRCDQPGADGVLDALRQREVDEGQSQVDRGVEVGRSHGPLFARDVGPGKPISRMGPLR